MAIDWRHPYSDTVIEIGYDDEAGERRPATVNTGGE